MPNTQGDAALNPGAQAAELWLRISVTLSALVAYRAGTYVPLPGLNADTLGHLYGGEMLVKSVTERISIFSLGLMPLFSVLIVVEVAKLIFPGFRQWESANERKARAVLSLVALCLAALQASGIASAMEGVTHLVDAPGFAFRTGTVGTLVAGTAFLMWLADVITRHGLGSGFWILLATPVVAGLPGDAAALIYLIDQGAIPAAALAIVAAFLIAGTAALVALAKANEGAEFPQGSVSPWPPVLAYASLGWLLAALLVLVPAAWRDPVVGIINDGYLFKLLLLGLLTGLFALLYANPQRLTSPGTNGLAYVVAAALVAIVLVPELISTYFNLPRVPDGQWLVIIVSVALGILSATSGKRAHAASAGRGP